MINIHVREREDSSVVTIQGHAKFAPKGQDIVCSAISTLYYSLHRFILTDTTAHIESIQAKNNENTLTITDMENDAKTALNYFIQGCEMVSDSYPANVQIYID